jgi:hypothetical protein
VTGDRLKVRHVNIGAFLHEALLDAQNGLRRGSIDEVDVLLERCLIFGRAQWPAEVVQFVESFKRDRGRVRSKRADMDRFQRDPNRVAAAHAAWRMEQMRPGGKGPYKISNSGSTVSAEAVQWAVEYVNNKRLNEFDGRKADPEKVAELVRRGRGRFPI